MSSNHSTLVESTVKYLWAIFDQSLINILYEFYSYNLPQSKQPNVEVRQSLKAETALQAEGSHVNQTETGVWRYDSLMDSFERTSLWRERQGWGKKRDRSQKSRNTGMRQAESHEWRGQRHMDEEGREGVGRTERQGWREQRDRVGEQRDRVGEQRGRTWKIGKLSSDNSQICRAYQEVFTSVLATYLVAPPPHFTSSVPPKTRNNTDFNH